MVRWLIVVALLVATSSQFLPGAGEPAGGEISYALDGEDVSPDGNLVLANRDDQAVLLTLGNDKEILFPRLDKEKPFHSAFLNQATLITANAHSGLVKVWNIDRQEAVTSFLAHKPQELEEGGQHSIDAMALAPDGSTLATGGLDGDVCLWSTKTWEKIVTLRETSGESSWCLAFSPDSQRLASLSELRKGSQLTIWDARSGHLMIRQLLPQLMTRMAWTHRGTKLAVAGFKPGLLLLYAATGGTILDFEPKDEVQELAFSPGDTYLVANTIDDEGGGEVKIWNTVTGELKRRMDELGCITTLLRFSRDGNLLFVSDGENLHVWSWRELEREMSVFTPGPPLRRLGGFLSKKITTAKLIARLRRDQGKLVR